MKTLKIFVAVLMLSICGSVQARGYNHGPRCLDKRAR